MDKHTDIWAFGCVLYEMLTAKAAFGADTITDTICCDQMVRRYPDGRQLTGPAVGPIADLRL